MSVLVLRLAAPLQAWGISKFERRGTERLPTKSAVIGLLAAALGRGRDEPIDDLISLKFGVRVEQEGTVLRDFHVARLASGNNSYITNRYYLQDAVFLVGLEGERVFLEKLEDAVRNPYYPIFLGRRSCPPAGKLSLGLFEGDLEEVMTFLPWQASTKFQTAYWRAKHESVNLRLTMDAGTGDSNAYTIMDHALSFSPKKRSYRPRSVSEREPIKIYRAVEHDRLEDADTSAATNHDPFAALREV